MNTPAHIIFAATAFARPHEPRRNLAALLGGLAPDLSLYLMTGWSILVMGVPPRVVFGEYYFSPEWQQVFAVDNSFLLWGALFAAAQLAGRSNIAVFALAGLLHLALDFPLHHDDGRPHFWPLSDWVFQSPVSYWDWRHHGRIVGAVETGLCLAALVVLWRRFSGWPARATIGAGGLMLAGPSVLFGSIF